MTEVHVVVMGNDFPKAVYANKADAQKLCDEQTAKQREDKKGWATWPICWRVYSFPLIESAGDE